METWTPILCRVLDKPNNAHKTLKPGLEKRTVRPIVLYALTVLCVLAVLSPASVLADALSFESKAQGWVVRFDAPSLDYKEMGSSDIRYRFFGRTLDGLFLSLHVEPLSASDNAHSCMDRYVRSADRLPSIVDKKSISMVDGDIQTVSYYARIDYRGNEYRMPNIHYYFPVQGYCADLHLGATPIYNDRHQKSFEQLTQELKDSLFVGIAM